MSLKFFHILFICASILLSLGFAGWSLAAYINEGGSRNLVFAVVSLVVAVALIFYGKYVLRKLKNITYL